MLVAMHSGDIAAMVVYGPPKIVTINVTTKCFAACRYCHYWYAPKEKMVIWPDLVEYVRSASALGTRVIRISGRPIPLAA